MNKNSISTSSPINEIVFGLSASEVTVLIVSVLIAALAIILVSSFRKAIVTKIEEIKASITTENLSILKKVADNLSPRIVHCSSEVDVAREANAMIERAIAAKGTKKIAIDGENGTEKIETPFVTFYGAADLSSPQTEGLTDEETEHFGRFNLLLREAVDNDVRVRRHINLFSKEELKKRTPEAQRQYLKWLIARFDFVFSNPSFEIIDNPRVPQWGASFSSLLTNDAILEIKANGLSGIAIYNPLISRSVRESLKRARKMADPDRIEVIKSSDQNSVHKYFEKILMTANVCGLDILELDSEGLPAFYNSKSQFEKVMAKQNSGG